MTLLGIDIGTTHCKVGVFDLKGSVFRIATRPTPTYREGMYVYYDPEQMWQTIVALIREVSADSKSGPIAVIGIASMAETGLLVDQQTGQPRSHMIPWFDQRASPQMERIAQKADDPHQFAKTGLHLSYKYGLPKILWLKDQNPDGITDAVWLSAADYIGYRLTGKMGTDYSLAARTYAFRIDQKSWDSPWLKEFDVPVTLFPAADRSGTPLGTMKSDDVAAVGIKKGIPVAISGHDHVCASVAVGAIEPGVVLDSMGTAETLVGTIEEKSLGEQEYNSGLSYGCHVLPGKQFWMGGLPASGGSVEWLRKQLGESALSYEYLEKLVMTVDECPTGILYYPYLSGSGAPVPDSHVQGAIIGLTTHHHRGHLVRAVLEGTAFEMESIRRTAEQSTHSKIRHMIAAGGGTRNTYWLRIKAAVSGCEYQVSSCPEVTLLGAAVVAGIGCQLYANEDEAVSAIIHSNERIIYPNEDHHHTYRHLYETGYLSFQDSLRRYYKKRRDESNGSKT